MFVVYLMFLCFEEEMDGKDEELTKHILNGKGHTELSGRLRAHVTEDEYKNRVLVLCFERQLKFGKVVRLALKDEQKYFKMLELESRNKMRIFPYHLQGRDSLLVCLLVSFRVSVFHHARHVAIVKLALGIELDVTKELVELLRRVSVAHVRHHEFHVVA